MIYRKPAWQRGVIFLCIGLFHSNLELFAQSFSVIHGQVINQVTGETIAQAHVTLMNTKRGAATD